MPLQCFLEQGKLLVLMDGLDEVPTNELRRNVQDQLRQVSKDYPKNRFILTCRTQIMEAIPDGFTSVEVADFSPEQVEQFVQNWFKARFKARFKASGESEAKAKEKSEAKAKEKWEKFNSALANKPDLKELTMTPVLLILMCLVLQDEGDMPTKRSWLYKKGIKLLLSRWNDEKQIDDWEVGTETYRKLDVEDKEALLIEIAARKFENPENFVLFKQDELADQITYQLQLTKRREGVAILKAIETQHGLLIERADELWSFSHLTFQEYFTVQWLTQLSSEQLAEKIANKQWQEVVKQLVKSQQPADRLLRLIKQAIEQSIAREPELQSFLTWLFQKSKSIQARYKPAAIRAFYYTLDRARDLDLDRARDLDRALDLDLDLDRARARALDRAFARALARTLDCALDCALDLDRALTKKLQQLKAALPALNNWHSFHQWWKANGSQWAEQLRQVIIDHRNIGHDRQFTDEQKQQLQRYYDANKFLVNLMKIEGAVSKDVRAEIEDTLLLPWAELQRRQPGIYHHLQ